jgi:hypothetical protein
MCLDCRSTEWEIYRQALGSRESSSASLPFVPSRLQQPSYCWFPMANSYGSPFSAHSRPLTFFQYTPHLPSDAKPKTSLKVPNNQRHNCLLGGDSVLSVDVELRTRSRETTQTVDGPRSRQVDPGLASSSPECSQRFSAEPLERQPPDTCHETNRFIDQ